MIRLWESANLIWRFFDFKRRSSLSRNADSSTPRSYWKNFSCTPGFFRKHEDSSSLSISLKGSDSAVFLQMNAAIRSESLCVDLADLSRILVRLQTTLKCPILWHPKHCAFTALNCPTIWHCLHLSHGEKLGRCTLIPLILLFWYSIFIFLVGN